MGPNPLKALKKRIQRMTKKSLGFKSLKPKKFGKRRKSKVFKL
jgi:hypothetical protein